MSDFEKELTDVELTYIDAAAYQLYKKASDVKDKEALKHSFEESVKFEESEIESYKQNIAKETNENVKIMLHGLAKNATVRKLINEKLIKLIDGQSNDSM